MIPTEEVIGPGGAPIYSPIPGRNIAFLQRFLFSISSEPAVSPHINALFLPRKNLTPSFRRPSTLAIEKKFSALRLRAKESHLWESAISAPLAAGRDELNPIF
jgi:hypothetical protein